MGQLDDAAAGSTPDRRRVAELRGKQDQQRPKPLTTGIDEVTRGVDVTNG